MRILLLAIVTIGIFASCQDKKSEKVIKYDHIVNVGEKFDVPLIANPSTGYMWRRMNGNGTGCLKSTSSAFTPDNGDMVGSPGTFTLSYEAIKSGVDTLNLHYMQAFKMDSKSDEKTLIIKVN